MEITDNLKASTENNFISCGLFLDFSKAFDTINYQILPDKLCKYGARGRPHDWFVSYLHDRKQFAQIGDEKSSLLEMTCGAPQGSTLVPLLEMTCGAPQGSTLVPLLEMTCGAPQGSTLVPLLFLIYINGIADSSHKLSFRLFADDANIFYASDDINDIESVINCEMTRALNYYSRNKLSVNMKKLTSY